MNKIVWNIVKYPYAAIFLIDFHLTWRRHKEELRGDVATNISKGIAPFLGWIGGLLRKWCNNNE